MIREILKGTVSGAVGTMALDMTSYADMMRSGRKASDVPAQLVEKLAARAGIEDLAPSPGRKDDKAKNRQSAAGALIGYGVGLGVGATYGAMRPSFRSVPWPVMGLLLGAAAMAAADVPTVRLGLSDPKEWGVQGWIGDIVPHVAYGLMTAWAYELFG